MAANVTPAGCGPGVDSLYYNLCDLGAAWGVVLEAFASAGVVFCLVLFMTLLASLPFMTDRNRRSSVALHAALLVFTAGLFGLTFAFVVGKSFATCASRRFLFGVLFAGCFSCLLMQSVRANVLARRNSAPSAWALCAGAVALWLVEVVINAEWLIVTVVRLPLPPLPPPLPNVTSETSRATATPCNIADEDFVMALIYVMVLMVAAVMASAAVACGKHKRWLREGVCVFLAGVLSAGIWAAWIAMYVHGNGKHGQPTWDDPTLAIALVANAWTFVVIVAIPEVCCSSGDDENRQSAAEELYANQRQGYENILKEHGAQSVFMENKGFSMDEPNQVVKPVSPYSGYTGQLRSSVYQPTELALITKAVGNRPLDSASHDLVIPRATAASVVDDSATSAHVRTQTNGHGENGLHRTSHW